MQSDVISIQVFQESQIISFFKKKSFYKNLTAYADISDSDVCAAAACLALRCYFWLE